MVAFVTPPRYFLTTFLSTRLLSLITFPQPWLPANNACFYTITSRAEKENKTQSVLKTPILVYQNTRKKQQQQQHNNIKTQSTRWTKHTSFLNPFLKLFEDAVHLSSGIAFDSHTPVITYHDTSHPTLRLSAPWHYRFTTYWYCLGKRVHKFTTHIYGPKLAEFGICCKRLRCWNNNYIYTHSSLRIPKYFGKIWLSFTEPPYGHIILVLSKGKMHEEHKGIPYGHVAGQLKHGEFLFMGSEC